MKRFILNLLVVLFLIPIGRAGEKQYLFQQIAPEKGLTYHVNCLTVSNRSGYAWMGTDAGIGRFNGYELKRYLNSKVFQILEDSVGQVWAAAEEGLFLYNALTDRFDPVHNAQGTHIHPFSICSSKGVLFFGGVGKIYQYDYQKKTIVRELEMPEDYRFAYTHMKLWDEHTLVVCNRWNHSLLIDIESGQHRDLPFNCSEVTNFFIDSQGRFWFAPYAHGLKCYSRDGKLLYEFHKQNSDLSCNVVLSLTESEGKIWAGTDGSGIFIIDPDSRKIDHLIHVPGDLNSLPSNSINALYTDSYSGVWAGSIRNGLFNIKEVGIKLYADALPNTHYGLSMKSVLSLYQETEKEDIWVGTDGGGLNRFVPSEQRFYHLSSTWGDKVVSIIGTEAEHLLVSLFGKGVYRFHKTTGQLEPLIIVNEQVNTRLCQQGKSVNLMKYTEHEVLLLSDDPYCYNWKLHTFQRIKVKNMKKKGVGEFKPIAQHKQMTYVCDDKHIYALEKENYELNSLLAFQGDTVIHSASVDEYGDIWIGGNRGLCRFSPATGKRSYVSTNLSSNLRSVICDQQGRVWIGSNEQLFAIFVDQNRFILYDTPDGVMPNEYLPKPRLLTKNGDIYLGTVNGLLHINHDLPKEDITHPVLELGEVLVGGSRVIKPEGKLRVLEIQEESNPVTLSILAHNKDIFRKPVYRYTLLRSGHDPVYSYLPAFSFSGLPAGTYQVRAACSTRLGGWTEDYPILEVVVNLPWYKSGWFLISCIIAIVCMFVIVSFWFVRRKEERLQWTMKEHEKQVYEEKVRFLININHELRTPLTLIHAPLKQLIEKLSPEDEQYRLLQGITNQSDRMKKLLNMVLDVRKMEVKESVLLLEEIHLEQWLNQILEDFRPEAALKNLTIVSNYEIEDQLFCCDKEKCNTIITNLLVNALKYSNNGGEISLTVKKTADRKNLRISISDQGIGLKGVDVKQLFTRFYQGTNSRPGTGIGLSYSKILVEQQGGQIGAYDHDGAPGATFWIELPLNLTPSQHVLHPQPYLNELLASVENIENVPVETPYCSETKDKRVLVVDDNQDMIDYLSSALSPYFQEILTASTGVEALEICRQSMPDVVVSDIQMPEMNGYELCKQIKEDFSVSHIPVLLLTARTDEESKSFGYKNGADNYLTKPFEISTLYTAVLSLLKNRERTKREYAEAGNMPLPTPKESTFSPVDEKFLEKLNKVIMDNLTNSDLGVAFLCSEMCISRASLYNKLKALTGMGSNSYVSKIRIEQAVKLLKTTDLSINDIADAVGFSSSRYFDRVFKETMGCSPSQFKEQQ